MTVRASARASPRTEGNYRPQSPPRQKLAPDRRAPIMLLERNGRTEFDALLATQQLDIAV